jgi:hypothetical protein
MRFSHSAAVLTRPYWWQARFEQGRTTARRLGAYVVCRDPFQVVAAGRGVRECLLLSIQKQLGHFVQVASPCAAPRHRGRGAMQCVSAEPWCSHAPIAVQSAPVRRPTNTGALCPYECWIAQSRLFAPLRATEKRYPLTGRLLFPADRILTVSPAITDGRWRLRDATALPLVTRRRLWIGLKVIARGISGTV